MAEDHQLNPPDFDVKVGGESLEEEAFGRISEIRVSQLADGPHMFHVKVFNQDEGDVSEFPNASSYKIGEEIEIQMGYGDKMETVFKGLITRLDAQFHEQDAPVFTLAGYDKLHKLTRQRITQHWEEVKFSDVASDLAGLADLDPDCKPTSVTFPYVSLNNQTPLSFLMDMARRVGYVVVCVDGEKMKFGPPEFTNCGELAYGESLVRGRFSAQTAGQFSKVRVFGYDDQAKEQVIGEATPGDIESLGNGTLGGDLASEKFKLGDYWITNFGANTQAEVDEVAKAVMGEHCYKFLSVEAHCEGEATLKAGGTVTISGVTPHFDGEYYITEAIHRMKVGTGPGSGYKTDLKCVSDSWAA
jgi:phage protein D